MLRHLIDRFAYWFADAFGTETAFGVCFVLLIVWLALIPVTGIGSWNATWGLGGNTSESTVELFLEIAILLKANQIARRQDEHGKHIERLRRRMDEKGGA